MKNNVSILFVLPIALLAACSKPDPELDRANAILASMTCPTSNEKWGAFMAEDRERGQTFIDKYKQGMHMFKDPIDAVLERQQSMFKSACDSSNKNAKY